MFFYSKKRLVFSGSPKFSGFKFSGFNIKGRCFLYNCSPLRHLDFGFWATQTIVTCLDSLECLPFLMNQDYSFCQLFACKHDRLAGFLLAPSGITAIFGHSKV